MGKTVTRFELSILYLSSGHGGQCNSKWFKQHDINFQVDSYAAGNEFRIHSATDAAFDLVFLEYSLDIMESILMANELKKMDHGLILLFKVKTEHDLVSLKKYYCSDNIMIWRPHKGKIDYRKMWQQVIDEEIAAIYKWKQRGKIDFCPLLTKIAGWENAVNGFNNY